MKWTGSGLRGVTSGRIDFAGLSFYRPIFIQFGQQNDVGCCESRCPCDGMLWH